MYPSFTQHNFSQGSFELLSKYSFLLLSSIPWCECTVIYPFTYLGCLGLLEISVLPVRHTCSLNNSGYEGMLGHNMKMWQQCPLSQIKTKRSKIQCSCLENPRDGGAWWAAIYGVAQSQTRLKRLSTSSSSSRFPSSVCYMCRIGHKPASLGSNL